MSDNEVKDMPTDAEATVDMDDAAAEGTGAPSGTTTPPAADELAAARAEAQKNLEGWQRTLAEFQNYKRRTEREQRESYESARADVLKSFLPIIDDFERAMSNLPDDLKGHAWLGGVTLIQRKMSRLLEDFNITVLDPVGTPFDPTLHQAVGAEDRDDVESGQVIETLQKGYALGELVLRPALVKVAS